MTLLDRLAAAPTRAVGITAAALALALMLIGTVVVPALFVTALDGEQPASVPQLARNTVPLLLGGAISLLGYLPLLTAVHALTGSRARPAALLVAGYLVLLIRPLLIAVEAAVYPGSVLLPFGAIVPYLLLATTGIAAGLAATAIVPLAQSAASTGRRIIVGVGIGVLVALALFSFAPFIAPLSALGVGVALVIRAGGGRSHDPLNGPAGQH